MLLFGCVANMFPSTVEKEHSDIIIVVSNTIAQDNRGRLLSFGCAYMLLPVSSFQASFSCALAGIHGWYVLRIVMLVDLQCFSRCVYHIIHHGAYLDGFNVNPLIRIDP